MSSTINLKENKSYYLPLLLIISIISHFPFVLKGFGEIDATKIAVSVIDILNHGSNAAFANFYFTDVIPLYILYLKWAMKLLNFDYSYLPLVMNYTNAVFGTLTVIPAFFLVRQLFRNSAIAFCSVLALIFAPSFYQSAIMGFPHLIALFFLLLSLIFYLSGLDHGHKRTVFLLMFLSCVFLTITFLFKSDYVLAGGAYIGFLFMRKVRDKGKIAGAFLIVIISGVLFFLLRYLILGTTGGTTMSGAGMSKWFDYFFIGDSISLAFLKWQIKPIIYCAGIVTFCLGLISLIYFMVKRRIDILIFIMSWTAAPTFLWFIIHGNNARHNMLSVLPILVMIVFLFYERFGRYAIVLTVMLILGNYFVTAPSSSILRPSGNLFKSNDLLESRMIELHSRVQEIVNLDENKIVVLGYFHNPHVIFEILRSALSYEAVKIGREDYKIQIGNKEYVFIYFVVADPKDIDKDIDNVLNKYNLRDHLFVSATYDLQSLNKLGLKTKTLKIIKAAL